MSSKEGKGVFQPPAREKQPMTLKTNEEKGLDTEAHQPSSPSRSWLPSKSPKKKQENGKKEKAADISASDKSLAEDILEINKQTPSKRPK